MGRLGAGGMGRVFLARTGDGALVALKLLHADLAEDPSMRTRFRREAAVARRVSGPYTAPLLAAGEDPRPWLATAYLPGPTLDEAVLRHGPLTAAATRALGAALAEALGSIHEAGVVHRDLKPGNVLLTADGPRVLDFGVAGGEDPGTADGGAEAAGGTPAYMAPEQLTGGAVSFPADVFALGGVLAFCLTGAPPFPGAAGGDRAVPRPPELDADAELRAVIAACLAEDPSRRPGVASVAAALAPGTAAGAARPPSPMALDIGGRATPTPVSIPTRPRIAGHGRRRVLQLSVMGAAALAGMGAARALTGAKGPAAASVLWTRRATVVTGHEVGPERDGGLFFLDRTVVTRSEAAHVDLCCLDAETGRLRWRRPLTPFAREGGGVVAALGSVWVRDGRGVYAVDPGTGALRWSRRRSFPGRSPAVACGDALMYDVGAVPSEGTGTVYAHEPRTGRVIWRRAIGGVPVGTIVVTGGVVYVVSAAPRGPRGHVHALDSATGAVHWTSAFGDDPARAESAASRYTDAALRVADDTVYVSVEGRIVHAIDARTGAVRWRIRPRPAGDGVVAEPYPTAAFPVAAGDTLLLGTGDGVMRAFRRRDGRRRWAAVTGASPVAVGASRRRFTPPVGYGLVFVRGADAVRALRIGDGRVRWEHRTDPSAGEPVLAGGMLHVPGRAEVTSHDPASGRIVQRLDLRDHRSPTALVAGRNALYVLAGVGTLIAIGLPD
ncbi:protein kinase domain-containing protein [Actinomadura algeriensis]|uniref:Outer membrane protein assembly factor BamB n=1 Tax=Actinomadura algeriensis TaxID=1679523 RepID=A0ABR9JQM6_9ACTN|nr:PQQ-binding-like beta-propeller repeat protein [Actinomadura algeriensis]MBE1532879.1 outer membrane protein assembly factor BamB [Actinomadura algeriensis]